MPFGEQRLTNSVPDATAPCDSSDDCQFHFDSVDGEEMVMCAKLPF
jgi:hypothetical protein